MSSSREAEIKATRPEVEIVESVLPIRDKTPEPKTAKTLDLEQVEVKLAGEKRTTHGEYDKTQKFETVELGPEQRVGL